MFLLIHIFMFGRWCYQSTTVMSHVTDTMVVCVHSPHGDDTRSSAVSKNKRDDGRVRNFVSVAVDKTIMSIVHVGTIHDSRDCRFKNKGHDGRVRNIYCCNSKPL